MGYNDGLRRSLQRKNAVIDYRRMAERGDAFAQYNLGDCYFDGDGVKRDEEEAVKWFRKSAEQGNAMAQYRLGDCYYTGVGVEQDEEEAVKWFRKSAEQENVEAQDILGDCYLNGDGVDKDEVKAVEWYRRAADQGNPYSQYKLGKCCYNGVGVAKNFEEAVKWYRKSADSGNGDAQYMLGNCYYNGEGVAKNAEEALKWWSRGAEKGSAVTQYELGNRCYYGDGVPKDYDKAAKWYRRAADSGHADAQYMLAGCYVNGMGVPRNYSEAVELYAKSADSGNEKAKYSWSNDRANYMGDCFYYGIGVAKNLGSALEWYSRASEQGDELAQLKLVNCCCNVEGLDLDLRDVVKWLKNPAESGNVEAQFKLADCYYNGNGVKRDYVEAVKWLKGPAESGNAAAQYILGECFYNGEGVAKDVDEALKWWGKSASSGNAVARERFEKVELSNNLLALERAGAGDFVKFGRYPQTKEGEVQPVEWQVLSKENGQMLVISRYGLDAKRFGRVSDNWDYSEIRKWLNGEFYNGSFAAEEKARIKSFNQDNVFLLSMEEAEEYFADDDARKCKPTSYAKSKGAYAYYDGCGWWWLRSPAPRDGYGVYGVSYDGGVRYFGVYNSRGSVRPALWINLESYGSSAEARADADVPDHSEIRKSSGSNPFKNAKVGDFVKFGRYPQTEEGEVWPVEWQVLAIENNRVLVISRYGLDAKRFDGSDNYWGNSEIRKWLNGEFYNGSFVAEEKARIKSFYQDNVFLLSRKEAEKYFADDDARKCKPTSYAKSKGADVINDGSCWWWLRSPNNINNVCIVSNLGDIYDYYVNINGGSVRPALWINLESYGSSAEACADADVPDHSEILKSSGSNPFKNAKVGDYVEFGRYPQTEEGEVQPVEWQVLSKENGQMLVISRYGLDGEFFDGDSNDWGNSEIRNWLNGDFYNESFAAEEKARIKSFNQDNVFLLSNEEAEKYFADDDARKCKPTSYAKAKGAGACVIDMGYCWWWLRSPDPNDSACVYCVDYDGGVYNFNVNCSYGSLRPALWINLESYGSSAEARADADVPDRSEIRKSSGSNPFKNANVGDFVKFGRYPQTEEGEVQPVEWQVLSRENGQMLVISRYGLDVKRFDVSSNNWGNSEIRQWLNGDFYNGSFAAEEKARIKSFNQDNVFLLSREEAGKYFANSDARKCKPTSYAKAKGAGVYNHGYCWWWLRSPRPYYSNYVFSVSSGGGIRSSSRVSDDGGSARPALWINLES